LPGDAPLLGPILTTDELLAVTSDRAWLQALLEVEVALALAQAELGVITTSSAARIEEAADLEALDIGELGRAARLGGNPVIPLVAALRSRVGADSSEDVHRGATSQDIIDTAMVLIVSRTVPMIVSDLGRSADAAAALVREHRHTPMIGRTLLQPAVAVTFGLVAAGWMVGLDEARTELSRAADGLTVQLGGPAGTLAGFGDRGPAVVAALARHLGLAEPVMPWHTTRQRVAVLASVLGIAAGTAAKLAGDVSLLMQPEVAEVAEPAAPGRGASSAMAHKRNPVLATEVLTAAAKANALVPLFLRSVSGELQRPLSSWHAEWLSMADLLALAGGAVARVRVVTEGLVVDPERMATNLATYGPPEPLDLGATDAFIDRALAARARLPAVPVSPDRAP
jgi:3-carboxy-cis,cis-muconate cycloisomerase